MRSACSGSARPPCSGTGSCYERQAVTRTPYPALSRRGDRWRPTLRVVARDVARCGRDPSERHLRAPDVESSDRFAEAIGEHRGTPRARMRARSREELKAARETAGVRRAWGEDGGGGRAARRPHVGSPRYRSIRFARKPGTAHRDRPSRSYGLRRRARAGSTRALRRSCPPRNRDRQALARGVPPGRRRKASPSPPGSSRGYRGSDDLWGLVRPFRPSTTSRGGSGGFGISRRAMARGRDLPEPAPPVSQTQYR